MKINMANITTSSSLLATTFLVASSYLLSTSYAFAPSLNNQLKASQASPSLVTSATTHPFSISTSSSCCLSMASRYGPPSDQSDQSSQQPQQTQSYEQQLLAFKDILNQIIHVNKRENLPRICTQNIELLVRIQGRDIAQICDDVMEEANRSNDQELVENTEAAIQYIVFFVETFVSQAKNMDDQNKALLGEIFKVMTGRTSLTGDIDLADAEESPAGHIKEQNLNNFMAQNKEQFTPGFLRHLEGECNRIQNAPSSTPESTKLLQLIRKVQLRVIEELGQDLGEGAQVLGQLIGYESKDERMAVLEAGLTVRGVAFAAELNALTTEALEGFQRVVGGADPGLIVIIQEIHDYIQVFIARNDR